MRPLPPPTHHGTQGAGHGFAENIGTSGKREDVDFEEIFNELHFPTHPPTVTVTGARALAMKCSMEAYALRCRGY